MSHSWVIVADASRARIFTSSQNKKEFREVHTLSHDESRYQNQELTSDSPGRTFDSKGNNRHAMEPSTPPKEQQARELARQVAELTDKERKKNTFYHLVVIAAPAMLGMLRDTMSKELRNLVTEEINKDLTQHDIDDIKSHLPDFLPD